MSSLPALFIGDRLEYEASPKGRCDKQAKSGVIVSQTDMLLVLDLGKYRDTILKNDIAHGRIKLVSIEKNRKGAGAVGTPKQVIIRPEKEYLAELFEKSGRVIRQAAAMCDPKVSDVTMAKWLREAGIIEPGERGAAYLPLDELRAAWEATNHNISSISAQFEVSWHKAKKALKDAGIISEGPTGITTMPDPAAGQQDATEDNEASEAAGQEAEVLQPDQDEDDEATEFPQPDQDEFDALLGTLMEADDTVPDNAVAALPELAYELNDSLEAIQDRILIYELDDKLGAIQERIMKLEQAAVRRDDNENEHDQEIVKKLVRFYMAPAEGRIEKLEKATGEMAAILIKNNKGPARDSERERRLEMVADIFARLLTRI